MSITAEDLPCTHDPDLFFSGYQRDQEEAKVLCMTKCPKPAQCLKDCLDYEFISGETQKGVHGGTTPKERNHMRGRAS